MPLKGKVAVVTGASSGIGRAIALELGSQRANVALLGRRLDALQSVAVEVEARGGSAQVYAVDLESDQELIPTTEALVQANTFVHVLIHSAGILTHGPVTDAPVEDFDRLYRLNLRAPYLLTQRLLPAIPAQSGQIVFINSTAGTAARAGLTQYAATKHGLKALADGLRLELAPRGIRVLSVYPARTATYLQENIFRREQRPYEPGRLLQPEEVARSVAHVLTMPQGAEIRDLAIRGVTDMSAG
jgi:NADP-dependent 3-hydroxy acid dehydrogenase YdfG